MEKALRGRTRRNTGMGTEAPQRAAPGCVPVAVGVGSAVCAVGHKQVDELWTSKCCKE